MLDVKPCLWIGPLGTNFNEILIRIYTFSFKKMHLKCCIENSGHFCLGLNVLSNNIVQVTRHYGEMWWPSPWHIHCTKHQWVNSLRPRLNRRPFTDDNFRCIFLNECPRISLKFVPKVRINNIPALVQIMAWGRSGGKPLSEPMLVSLLTHICVTRPQWVKWLMLLAVCGAWMGRFAFNSLLPGWVEWNFR